MACTPTSTDTTSNTPNDTPNDNAITPSEVRVALFNVKELSSAKIAAYRDLTDNDGSRQVDAAIRIVQTVRPDILVLQEIDQGTDNDPASVARAFAVTLSTGEKALSYPHAFSAPSNTGRLSGIDLDGDGVVATNRNVGGREHGNDSFGFGTYPGQYSMAVLSRFPIDAENARTFQKLLWKDLPGNHLSNPPPEGGNILSDDPLDVFRLSSKSHWDLPVYTAEEASAPLLHLLISHPTPPAFDGPEDKNGRRNFDEIKLWAHYLDGVALRDDKGNQDPFSRKSFVIAGDLNAYPQQTDSLYDGRTAISQLLDHPKVQESDMWLSSEGALAHSGEAAGEPWFREQATTGFRKGVRIDYLLPSKTLTIEDGGVFWPNKDLDPDGAALAETASDHRLIWLDLLAPSDS